MKIRLENKNLIMYLESDQEWIDYQLWVAEVRELMPKLSKLFDEEPLILSRDEFRRKQREENLWTMPSVKPLLQTGLGHLALISGRKLTAERWANGKERHEKLQLGRTILAELKLLLFVPYEQVLREEKDWRIGRYLAEVRDKSATDAAKDAKYKAERNADMCVLRAKERVEEFFKKHPEFAVEWAMLHNIARHGERATGSTTN